MPAVPADVVKVLRYNSLLKKLMPPNFLREAFLFISLFLKIQVLLVAAGEEVGEYQLF